ncbi:transporter [Spirochaetia bacterium]|nr:transporter [Spirochaetia bacterium]GHV57211.1 transporter [Spirochaetia bacterium]
MKIRKLQFHNMMLPYYFLSPAAILFLVFLLYPILNVVYFSFQHYNPSAFYGNGPAGFENYINILTGNKRFVNAFLTSLKWILSEVSLQLLFGLVVALLLNQKFHGRALVRSLIFAPWALSGVIVSILWSLLYNEHIGLINDVLMRLSLIKKPVAWLGTLQTVFPAVVAAELWRGIPFFAISLLAALQSVPDELYESCSIDGGGALWKFFAITLPYIKDTIILTTLLRSVWEFNSVDLIMNLTGGGPANHTTTLSVYIANLAIKNQEFGYGSAVAIVSFLFLLIFAATYLHFSKFGEESL